MGESRRSTNDRVTDARLQQIIRYLLDQEVTRLLADNSALDAQVATNTADIATNVSGIATNVTDIAALEQRAAARVPASFSTQDDLSHYRRFCL